MQFGGLRRCIVGPISRSEIVILGGLNHFIRHTGTFTGYIFNTESGTLSQNILNAATDKQL